MNNFEQLKAEGQTGEQALDAFFSRYYKTIKVAPLEWQRFGIDRLFIDHDDSQKTIEYKTDYKFAATNNIFLEWEIIETDGSKSKGWIKKSIAQQLIYYSPQKQMAFQFEMATLKDLTNGFMQSIGPTKTVKTKANNGGEIYAIGVLVPISELALYKINHDLSMIKDG